FQSRHPLLEGELAEVGLLLGLPERPFQLHDLCLHLGFTPITCEELSQPGAPLGGIDLEASGGSLLHEVPFLSSGSRPLASRSWRSAQQRASRSTASESDLQRPSSKWMCQAMVFITSANASARGRTPRGKVSRRGRPVTPCSLRVAMTRS